MRLVMTVLVLALGLAGCDRGETAQAPQGGGEAKRVRIALNWVPEPEFGGIYAAEQQGFYKDNGLQVEIMPGGAGAPTWQLVGTGQVEFAIASADEVAIARTRGADIVAIFTTYQTCPQGIMAHKERGLNSLADVFKGGTLAIEKGLAYAQFLERKYGFGNVKLVPYDGGVATFLADRNFAQQCFVFSEPIAARRQGANPQVFLVADSGYNPYTAVVIAKREYVEANKATVDAMLKSLRAGWISYLEDPKPANEMMGKLNKTMDAQTFAEGAEAQMSLIVTEGMDVEQVGKMTLERWQELIAQLRELKVLDKDVAAEECFRPVPW